MKDNKFIAQPFVPKTETRIVLENKEPTQLTKIANYLGISTVYNCGPRPCACNGGSSLSGSLSQTQAVSAALDASNRVAAQYGGRVDVSTSSSGSVNVTYTSPKR